MISVLWWLVALGTRAGLVMSCHVIGQDRILDNCMNKQCSGVPVKVAGNYNAVEESP